MIEADYVLYVYEDKAWLKAPAIPSDKSIHKTGEWQTDKRNSGDPARLR